MASLNNVVLIGNLTADPELRQTVTGKSVCNFGIAVDRPFAKEGQQDVDFINIVCWEKQADFVAKYFSKGDPIYVRGQIQTRTWTDEQNQKRYATEIRAEDVSFVRAKAPSEGASDGSNFHQEEKAEGK